jgi:hypothetical protein
MVSAREHTLAAVVASTVKGSNLVVIKTYLALVPLTLTGSEAFWSRSV